MSLLLLFLISIAAYYASLFPCSVCLDAQYEICQNTGSACGKTTFLYPFGVGERGCGLPAFQINCVEDSSPVFAIDGQNYTIIGINYDSHNLFIFNDENCRFLGDDNVDQELQNSDFGITSKVRWSLNVITCMSSNSTDAVNYIRSGEIKKCNATVYYSFVQDWIPGCVLQQLSVDVAVTQWVSKDAIRDHKCVLCQASDGICGYDISDSTAPFVCYCKDGPRTDLCANGKNVNYGKAIGVSFGATVLILAGLLGCITLHRRRKRRMFGESFVVSSFRNNEHKDIEAVIQGQIGKLPNFPYEVLKEATNDFDDKNRLGDGGHGSVYLGKLRDGRTVAVKKLYHDNYRKLEQFINEVHILSTFYHPNLVRLYGCSSPKSPALLIVYEYVQNGTLADHLHGERKDKGGLNWDTRLKICIEIARALAYLHCHDPPLFHRDIKSANILLDEELHVKVGDFGLSRFMPSDATHISTAPQGTPGYIDPEYHICFQLTDKSDVYSFGVVLMEIISAKLAVDISRTKEEIILANMAITKIQDESLNDLIDPSLDIDSNPDIKVTVTAVAKLAFKCLAPRREDRPDMKEIVAELEQVKPNGGQFKYATFIHQSPTSVHELWPSTGITSGNSGY